MCPPVTCPHVTCPQVTCSTITFPPVTCLPVTCPFYLHWHTALKLVAEAEAEVVYTVRRSQEVQHMRAHTELLLIVQLVLNDICGLVPELTYILNQL